MITAAVKKVITKMKKVDPEFAKIVKQVSEQDTRVNCLYFDRFTKSVRGAQ